MAFVYRDIIIGNSLTTDVSGRVITTNKGDTIIDDGTKSTRLPVGANGQVVVANTAAIAGMNWRNLVPTDVGLGNVSNTLNNLTATVNPTVNNDSSQGYSVGSIWLNQTTKQEYTLYDATVGAAIWVNNNGLNSSVAGNGLTYDTVNNQLNVGGSTTILVTTDDVRVNSSGTANQVLLSSGTVGTQATYGAVPLNNTSAITGTLGIGNGGTGVNSFTAANRLIQTNAGNNGLISSTLDPSTIVTLTGTQTLTNKTLVTPVITTAINDSNGNKQISLTSVASAVNEINISNAATGVAPSIVPSGTDTNIDLTLNGKGTGRISISGNKFPNTTGLAGQVLTTDGAGNITYSSVPIPRTATINTTDGTATTVAALTITTAANTVYNIKTDIIAKETNNTSRTGTFNIQSVFRNTGTAGTKIGENFSYLPLLLPFTASVNISGSGSNVIITYVVTGLAGSNITWTLSTTIMTG